MGDISVRKSVKPRTQTSWMVLNSSRRVNAVRREPDLSTGQCQIASASLALVAVIGSIDDELEPGPVEVLRLNTVSNAGAIGAELCRNG